MKTNSHKNLKLLVIGSLVILIIVITLSYYQEKKTYYSDLIDKPLIIPTQQTESSKYKIDNRYIDLTPTIISSSQSGWKTFIFPIKTKKFTFDYPGTWEVSLSQDKYASVNDLALSVFEKDDDAIYGIFFMQGGRGGPNYDYSKTEKREYGGRKATRQTLYR